jgi:hypothetical protein
MSYSISGRSAFNIGLVAASTAIPICGLFIVTVGEQ